MKPAWDELMDAYADSKDYLIADVDCTAEGKPLCSTHGVRGYPTIKYGNPADLKDYKGKRDSEALKQFAEENLKPLCTPRNLDRCSAANKENIKKFQAMDAAALDGLLATEEGELKEKEAAHNAKMKELEDEFSTFKKEKAAGISLMRTVKIAAGKPAKEEL